MSADPGNRFHHLLQPIRDLSKVWNIEIADELEKYIEEVSSLAFQTDEGSRKLNFAEAALLIQGSTAIYSRKVEQLYNLVYQALGQLAYQKEKTADGLPKKRTPLGLVAPIPETDELLTIDHLIKEGRNINLDESVLERQEQRQALHRRIPLFLLPKERTDAKQQDFHIGRCHVHSSGAYLLQASDARLLDEQLSRGCPEQCSPLAPPPPSEVRELDEQLQLLLRGLPENEGAGLLDPSPLPPEDPFAAPDGAASPLLHLDIGRANSKNDGNREDPWALLDEDAVMERPVPVEVGSCTKRFGNKGLLAKGEGLPPPGTWEPLTDAEAWRPGRAAAGLPGLLATGHPVNSLFQAVAARLRKGGRSETERAGFSAAWLEFEDLFQAAAEKRGHGLVKKRKIEAEVGCPAPGSPAPGTPPQACRPGEDLDGEGGGACTPPKEVPWQTTPWKSDEGLSDGQGLQDEHRQEVARLEGLIENAQSQYETSIHLKLQELQGGKDVDNQKYPELYENVRKWQDQLAPKLKEFESHPEFNISSYGDKILGKMVAVQKEEMAEDEQDNAIPFSRLVYGHPHWEVCRRFLTCLMLTNRGNTDIVVESEDDRINNFGVKLLKAEPIPISLDAEIPGKHPVPEEAGLHASVASAVPTPLRRRGRKRMRPASEEAPLRQRPAMAM